MATILAHIKIKDGKEARFEELEGVLWRDTHANEQNVRRYEFWRGAEKGTYYGLLSFNSFNGFIEHQASPHHEDSGLGEVIEGIRLEWVDPVPSASDLRHDRYRAALRGRERAPAAVPCQLPARRAGLVAGAARPGVACRARRAC